MQAYRDHRSGKATDAALAIAQDDAIREAITLQEAVGLESITDGEFRRASYWSSFVERVDGLEIKNAAFTFRDECGHEQAFTAPHVSGPVRRQQAIAVDEFKFVRA